MIPLFSACHKVRQIKQEIQSAGETQGEGDDLQTISRKMEEALREKYGTDFTICGIEEIPGRTGLDRSSYRAEVSRKDGEDTFTAYMDLDGKHLEDSYAKLLYDDAIRGMVEEVIRDHEEVHIELTGVIYVETERKWDAEDPVLEYLAESDTYADIEAKAGEEDKEETIRCVYGLAQDLKDAGIPYSIALRMEGRSVYIQDNKSISLMSYETLWKKITREPANE